MEPFKTITSKVSPLDRVNVDTDAIIPKQFLTRIERSGFGQFLFYEWRFDRDGQPNSKFVMNDPKYTGSNILISRANFGCGSSREHAPWALLDYGFKVIIATSYADIFYNNCFKNGILPIQLSEDTVEEIFQRTYANEGYQLTINLETQTISDSQGFEITFEVDPFRKKYLLMGYDDISITLEHVAKISEYEKTIPEYYSIK